MDLGILYVYIYIYTYIYIYAFSYLYLMLHEIVPEIWIFPVLHEKIPWRWLRSGADCKTWSRSEPLGSAPPAAPSSHFRKWWSNGQLLWMVAKSQFRMVESQTKWVFHHFYRWYNKFNMYFMGDYDCFNHIIVGLSWDVKTTRFQLVITGFNP